MTMPQFSRVLTPVTSSGAARGAFARRIGALVPLSEHEAALIGALPLERRHAAADINILGADSVPRAMVVLQEGWAFQYRRLSDGRRQILAISLPGDLVGFPALSAAATPYALRTVTPALIGLVDPARIAAVFAETPTLTLALHRLLAAERDSLAELAVLLGRLTAYERVAHMMVGLWRRLRAVGLAEADRFDLPLTQAELSDLLGLSPVHVNRTLQQLRRDGLLDVQRRTAILLDPDGLQSVAAF